MAVSTEFPATVINNGNPIIKMTWQYVPSTPIISSFTASNSRTSVTVSAAVSGPTTGLFQITGMAGKRSSANSHGSAGWKVGIQDSWVNGSNLSYYFNTSFKAWTWSTRNWSLAPSTSASVNITTNSTLNVTKNKHWKTTINLGTSQSPEYSMDNSSFQSSAQFNNLTPNTTYTFYIRARATSASDNSSGYVYSSVSGTTTGNAPTINSITPAPARTTCSLANNSITYDTNASFASVSVSYGTSTSYDKTSSSTSLSNLNPNTTYYYSMTVTDTWGRTSAAKTGNFTTTGNAPSISGVSTDVYRTKCILTPSVSYDTNASFSSVTIRYGTTTSYSLTSSSYTLTDLSAKTKYYYQLTITDNWGRSSAATGDFTTTAYLPYNLSITASNITPFTAALSVGATGDTNANITNYTYYYTLKPSVNTYDMPIKSFGGARWARIFYHNNKQGTVFFTSLAECKNIQTEDKYSRLGLLDSGDTYKINGKYEFLLEYPIDAPGQYNRWRQTNAPQNEYIARATAGGQVTGYEAVHIDWTANYWGGLERFQENASAFSTTWLDGSCGHGNWFYAIGAATSHGRGIPSYSSTADVVELWIRIPDGNVSSVSMGTSTTATASGLNEETDYLFVVSATNIMGTNYSSSIAITTLVDQAKIRIKLNGAWKQGKTWIKLNNQWVKVKKVYIKENGTWKKEI